MNRDKLLEILTETAERIQREFGANDFLYCKAEEDVKSAFDCWKETVLLGDPLSRQDVEDSVVGLIIVRTILDSFPEREWIWQAYSEIEECLD